MSPGDYVVHNTFPPVEGIVVGCQELNTYPKTYKVCVKVENDRLYWDDISTWNVISSNDTVEDIIDDSIEEAEYRIIE